MTVPYARGRRGAKAWLHVDMDGLDAICQCQGRVPRGGPDGFFLSAVENSLRFFGLEGVTATYFVIARDLDDPVKRRLIRDIVRAGHQIACHGLNHRHLDRACSKVKREEVFTAKGRIEDALGISCDGFRAPGYSIDYQSLQLLREAGFRYDSSVFPSYAFRKRLGINRLFHEPFELFPESAFFEIPMPFVAEGLPPFHPCYAFYLGFTYFSRCLARFAERSNYLTLLFHLTDFSERQKLRWDVRLNVFTNNYFSARTKLDFLTRIVREVKGRFEITTTEGFLRDWPHSAPDLNPRTILGVSTTHETGACIVRDGAVLSAINEERLSRRKLDTRYPPADSIREAIRVAGIEPQDIDAVAIAGLHWRDLLPQSLESFWRDVRDFHSVNDYFPHLARIGYRLFYFYRATGYERVLRLLSTEYGIRPKLYYVEHHEAHAASAFRGGPSVDALIMTADGVGDDVCITFSRGEGSTIRRLETFFYPHSFGQFYTACTQVLGFKGGRHEGKVTGLSGYGRLNRELLDRIARTLLVSDGGFRLHKRYYAEGFVRASIRELWRLVSGRIDPSQVEYRSYKPPLRRLLREYLREDVAYAFQNLLEREAVRLALRHLDGRPLHLALAGGVFANVKLNAALCRALGAQSVFIYPNMGDGGLCVGAALTVRGHGPSRTPHVYLGTAYGEAEITRALQRFPELNIDTPTNLPRVIAHALADRKIVARFHGQMEFGPRALGNRSILYHCGDPFVNQWLNKQLGRAEFMPFAPMCLYENAEEYFVLNPGEQHACEFMTYVVGCTAKMIATCSAAVHVDGTARPQLLRREVNPEMYEILNTYRQLTGIACIINTSFNMHEEPIVRSPEEAIETYLRGKLDLLAIGPFLVSVRARCVRASSCEPDYTTAQVN